jgi:hypothetical protein
VVVVLVAAALLLAAAVAGGDRGRGRERVRAGGGLTVVLPRGWHLIRRATAGNRRVPDQPAVLASFRAIFGRHPCPCATPNYRNCGAWCEEPSIRNFPRAGALVYVWEFRIPRNPANLGRGFVSRPAGFVAWQKDPHFARTLARELRRLHRAAGRACVEGPGSHPSWWSDFYERGRAFQLEVYLGPGAGQSSRASLDTLLDGLSMMSTPTAH